MTPNLVHQTQYTPLNMLHLELLHYWSSGLYKSFHISMDNHELYADACIRHGLQHPFLMIQILAASSLSMSISRPEQRDFYHQHAVRMQAEALAGFHAIYRLDEGNIVPAFLMSSLVALHSFCETFTFRHDEFNPTLDALINCISLLRGVRSVIGDWWPFLLASEIGPILITAHERREKFDNNTYRLDNLRTLVASADVSNASKAAYDIALQELEILYAIQQDMDDPEAMDSANMILSWLVVIPKEFVEALSARRPEALIILAYYAIMLHRRKQFWAVGDAGQFLIKHIAAHLGNHWNDYLDLPLSAIAS